MLMTAASVTTGGPCYRRSRRVPPPAEDVRRLDLIWLDLQGMELQVLQAAPKTLAITRAIYLELWREPMYAGCPTYTDVVAWMRAAGFDLRVDKVHRVAGNALFVNSALAGR